LIEEQSLESVPTLDAAFADLRISRLNNAKLPTIEQEEVFETYDDVDSAFETTLELAL
jgi:hypothetical protein